MNDRMITTTMSARIVSGLLKNGWTVGRIAKAIDAPSDFIEGVKAKRHVLTMRDINALARREGQSVNMMILNSLGPVKPELRPLFDSVKDLIGASESAIPHTQRRSAGRKKRPKTKAA
jgi:hypothetical protein